MSWMALNGLRAELETSCSEVFMHVKKRLCVREAVGWS